MFIKSVTGENGKTVFVTVEDELSGGHEQFCVSARLWQKLSGDVRPLMPVDESLYIKLKEAADRTAALREASRMIGYGEKSRRDILKKLRTKQIDKDAAEWAVDVLEKNGYINEDGACRRIAESAVATKHYGRRRVLEYLLSHGYDREAAESAVDGIDAADYSAALEYNIAHKFPDIKEYDIKEKQKAYAALMRLGFSPDEIADAIRGYARGTRGERGFFEKKPGKKL